MGPPSSPASSQDCFDRAEIPGNISETVSGVPLTKGSLVVATLQQHRGSIFVTAAVPNVSKHTVTIYLSKRPAANTRVAWVVVS